MPKGGQTTSVVHHCPGGKSGKSLPGNCRSRLKSSAGKLYCPEHQKPCEKHTTVIHLATETCPKCDGEARAAQAKQEKLDRAAAEAKRLADKKKQKEAEDKEKEQEKKARMYIPILSSDTPATKLYSRER